MRAHIAEKSRGGRFNRSVFVNAGRGGWFLYQKKKKTRLQRLKVEQFVQRVHGFGVLSSLSKVSCSYNIQLISHVPPGGLHISNNLPPNLMSPLSFYLLITFLCPSSFFSPTPTNPQTHLTSGSLNKNRTGNNVSPIQLLPNFPSPQVELFAAVFIKTHSEAVRAPLRD